MGALKRKGKKSRKPEGGDPTGCQKALSIYLEQLGPGKSVPEVLDRTRSMPPGPSLTCCPSPTRSPRRSQLEICRSSSSCRRASPASQGPPLVNSPGQSRRRPAGRPAHSKPRRSREGERRPEPRLGKPGVARRPRRLQSRPGLGYFRPHLRWRSSWLARART